MGWKLRPITSFPAHFGRILVEAVTFSPRPVLFGSYKSNDEARAIIEDFRYFRWCLRKEPLAAPALSQAEASFQFRLSREYHYDPIKRWTVLYLTATPDRLGEMETLNPHLGSLIAAIE